MVNKYILKKIKKTCTEKHCKLIAVLYSKDNEDFIENNADKYDADLPVYIVIYDTTKKSIDRYGTFIYELNRNICEELKITTHIDGIDLPSYKSLRSTITSIKLRHNNSFKFIYKIKNYKEPQRIKTTLNRIGMNISFIINKIYTISVPYKELKKICNNKPNKFYESDLFTLVCNNNKELNDIKKSYKLNTELKETRYDDNNVVFYFYIKELNNIVSDSLNPSGGPQHNKLLEYFEKDEKLNDYITTMFKAIINLDEHKGQNDL